VQNNPSIENVGHDYVSIYHPLKKRPKLAKRTVRWKDDSILEECRLYIKEDPPNIVNDPTYDLVDGIPRNNELIVSFLVYF
jgi:hypothetical protein